MDWTNKFFDALTRSCPRCTIPGIVCAEDCPWATPIDGGGGFEVTPVIALSGRSLGLA